MTLSIVSAYCVTMQKQTSVFISHEPIQTLFLPSELSISVFPCKMHCSAALKYTIEGGFKPFESILLFANQELYSGPGSLIRPLSVELSGLFIVRAVELWHLMKYCIATAGYCHYIQYRQSQFLSLSAVLPKHCCHGNCISSWSYAMCQILIFYPKVKTCPLVSVQPLDLTHCSSLSCPRSCLCDLPIAQVPWQTDRQSSNY